MLPVIQWQTPPNTLCLERQVHVWRISLDLPASSIVRHWINLADDERARAERFCFRRDRERFIANRGLLREILSYYLDCDPAQLHFRYNPFGKPTLDQNVNKSAIHFSVSHSNTLGLIALADTPEIGVDIERIDPIHANMTIAEQFFSPREVAVLRMLPRTLRIKAFYNCWTRKEAFVKAMGLGLSMSLQDFDVSIIPGEPVTLLRVHGDDRAAQRWELRELFPEPGYAAALAIAGHGRQVKCRGWSETSARLRKEVKLSNTIE
ncbi:MAG: 4'-phosphopantetheinyl transferase superfamily protein [Chloroflexi bacterium]|nr:4'-phosphopantetheinyl transferase superfamily protein [Chloroflexota bacterium]